MSAEQEGIRVRLPWLRLGYGLPGKQSTVLLASFDWRTERPCRPSGDGVLSYGKVMEHIRILAMFAGKKGELEDRRFQDWLLERERFGLTVVGGRSVIASAMDVQRTMYYSGGGYWSVEATLSVVGEA